MFDNESTIADTGGNFVLAPADNHFGRLCAVIEIGTVDNEGTNDKGQKFTTHERKVLLGFELVNTNHIFDEEKGPEPFVIYKEFTFKISKKSKLGLWLKSWLGKSLPWLEECKPEDVKKFHLHSLLGKELGKGAIAMINVTHGTKKDGGNKAEISGVTPVPAGVVVPVGRIKQTLFNFNLPFKSDVFKSLPKYMQDKIQKSDEYKKLVGMDSSATNAIAAATAVPVQQTAGQITPPPTDDLPF
jgi:hypothetical protein